MKEMKLHEKQKFGEFMNSPMNMEQRNQKTYSDEFVIRKAEIYEVMGPKNDKLKVQILPEFYGIDEEEMKNLPEYPMFYQGEVITGLSRKVDGDMAESVWVICTPDFQVGYILGKANNFGKLNKNYENSYGYSKVKEYMAARQAVPEEFDYNHVEVIRWVESGQGGLIECYNYLTGDYILLNSSGSIITLQQKRIFIRVGTPNDDKNSDPTAFSAITMTPDEVFIKTPNFVLDANDVTLGKHNLNLLGTLTSGVVIGRNGISAQSISNIHV